MRGSFAALVDHNVEQAILEYNNQQKTEKAHNSRIVHTPWVYLV